MPDVIKGVAGATPPKGYENCTCVRVDTNFTPRTKEQYYLIMRSKSGNGVWFNYYVDGKLFSQQQVADEIFNEAVKAVNGGQLWRK